jgi:hypothetical protein
MAQFEPKSLAQIAPKSVAQIEPKSPIAIPFRFVPEIFDFHQI